jgi:hypothetical protein
VPNEVPPEEVLYQFKLPELAAWRTKVPASHRDAGVVELILGVVFIVAAIAVLEEVHPPIVAST